MEEDKVLVDAGRILREEKIQIDKEMVRERD